MCILPQLKMKKKFNNFGKATLITLAKAVSGNNDVLNKRGKSGRKYSALMVRREKW